MKPIRELSRVSVAFFRRNPKIAAEIAKITVDLTSNGPSLRLTPNGVNIGDRVKTLKILKRSKGNIEKGCKGNVVGFDKESGRYLTILFPAHAEHGTLVMVEEGDFTVTSKARSEENVENTFAEGPIPRAK